VLQKSQVYNLGISESFTRLVHYIKICVHYFVTVRNRIFFLPWQYRNTDCVIEALANPERERLKTDDTNISFWLQCKHWVSCFIAVLLFSCTFIVIIALLVRQTDTRLTASVPGQPEWTGTRKVKPVWIFMKQVMMKWHQLDHMQIICTLLPTYNSASTSSLIFLQASCASWCPTNSVKALKSHLYY